MNSDQSKVLQTLQQQLFDELEVCNEYIADNLDLVGTLLTLLAKTNSLLEPTVKEQVIVNNHIPAQSTTGVPIDASSSSSTDKVNNQQSSTANNNNSNNDQQQQQQLSGDKPKFKFADGYVVRGREHLMEAQPAIPHEQSNDLAKDLWAESTSPHPNTDNSTNNGSGSTNSIVGNEQQLKPSAQQPITRQQLQQPYSVPNAQGMTHDNRALELEQANASAGVNADTNAGINTNANVDINTNINNQPYNQQAMGQVLQQQQQQQQLLSNQGVSSSELMMNQPIRPDNQFNYVNPNEVGDGRLVQYQPEAIQPQMQPLEQPPIIPDAIPAFNVSADYLDSMSNVMGAVRQIESMLGRTFLPHELNQIAQGNISEVIQQQFPIGTRTVEFINMVPNASPLPPQLEGILQIAINSGLLR